ncbi:MAG: ATP-binding protein [Segetibacter sp.]
MIKSVIRNLIDNAIKNTSNGNIAITTTCLAEGEACQTIIADEGKVLTSEQINELNHYFHSDLEVLAFSTAQFGHKIIKDFLQKGGGSMTCQQNTPSGLIVTLTLPLIQPFSSD